MTSTYNATGTEQMVERHKARVRQLRAARPTTNQLGDIMPPEPNEPTEPQNRDESGPPTWDECMAICDRVLKEWGEQ